MLTRWTVVIGLITAFQSTFVVGMSYDGLKELKRTLFENYDPSIRPCADQNSTIYVNVTLNMKQLDSLDIKRQALKWSGWVSARWVDEILTWNESQYSGHSFITVPQSRLWLPDYVLNNDVISRSRLGDDDTLVIIRSNGVVIWEPGIVTETSCNVDIKKYPFDDQECCIEVLPWMSTSRYITSVIEDKINFLTFTPHGEFIISAGQTQYRNISASFHDDSIVALQFFIHLKRRQTFYWMSMMFPMVSFPLLCPISFLVPVDCGEKITLAITVVLSYLVFIASLNEEIPQLSDTVSLLVLYATLQTAIGMLTVVANGIIICLYKMAPCNMSSKEQEKNLQSPSSNQSSEAIKTPNYHLIARKLDKICFVFFLLLALVATIAFGYLVL